MDHKTASGGVSSPDSIGLLLHECYSFVLPKVFASWPVENSYISMFSAWAEELDGGEDSLLDAVSIFANYDFHNAMRDIEPRRMRGPAEEVMRCVNAFIEVFSNVSVRNRSLFEGLTVGEQQIKSLADSMSSIIKKNIGADLSKMASYHSRVAARKSLLESNNKEDMAGLAQWFGAGALAVAMPVVGIPALAGKFFMGRSKNEKIEQEWQALAEAHDAAIDLACDIAGEFEAIESDIEALLREKFVNLIQMSISSIQKNGGLSEEEWSGLERAICENVSGQLRKFVEANLEFHANDPEWVTDFLIKFFREDVKEFSTGVGAEIVAPILAELDSQAHP